MRNGKLTKPEVIERINDLIANGNVKYAKYQKNYALYNQCPAADLKAKIPMAVGYIDDVYSEDSVVPKLNVVKSAIDAVVSKISTAHCRPFVNTVKGSFKTIQICKQLQVFFDYYFDEKNVQSKITEALRDACIFDSGYLYLDEINGDIKVVEPWNVYTRQREKNDFRSVYVEFPNASVDSLKDEDFEFLNSGEKRGLYVTIGYFYDARSKTKATLVNRQIRDISSLQSDVIPVCPIYYTMPIVGNTTLSIADMLKGIQVEVDELMMRISDASVLNPAQTILLGNASNIKVGQLNNKVGNVVQYNSQNPAGAGVDVVTPEFISSQYITLLDNLIEKAYNMVGISQLSAQGKKPSGLDSGVALATQADIESDRFQVLLDQYIRTFTELAKIVVKVFEANKDIIKPNRYNLRLTWGDVEKEYDKMRIQFSAADNLSKDPSEKLKQLQTLAMAGIIPATQIASLLELPDINRGYSVANNAWNACQTLIDQCIYEDKYEIPDYVPFQMLKEQIVNMQLSLRTAQGSESGNEDDIKRLIKYYEMVEDHELKLEQNNLQQQTTMQDVNENNMYSAQNNENLSNGTEDSMNMNNEAVANPMQTDAANGGELGE
jgi:hypothetical protein